MKCKFCQAELDDDSQICPACGKDNAEVTGQEENPCENQTAEETCCCAPESEQPCTCGSEETEQPCACCGEDAVPEQPQEPKKKKSVLKITLAVVGAVVLVALLAVLVKGGMDKSAVQKPMVAGPDGQMVEATVPADGSKDDETCKGSYTVSDKKAQRAADTVIATANGKELTNAELQAYYWMQVYDFLKNYGSYAASSGLDVKVPLDMQACPMDEGRTWQQYFLKTSLASWHLYVSLEQESTDAGHMIAEDMQAYLDGLEASLNKVAVENEFASAEEMLRHDLGAGSTMAGYLSYMNRYYKGYSYYGELINGLVPTEEMAETYFDEHAEDFKTQGVEKDGSVLVDVRHILIKPTAEEGAEPNTYTDEAWEACRVKAQEILDGWLAGDKSEENFSALATKHTEDTGSKATGGLYENVKQGQMVPEFDAWCFDQSRKAGDYGLVKSMYGYHIMYYSDSNPVWLTYALEAAKNQMLTDALDEIKAKYPMEIDYSKIVLDDVKLG